MKKISIFFAALLCVSGLYAKTIYLNTGGSACWGADNPAFFAHSWEGSDFADSQMTLVSGDVYSASVPDAHTSIIFVRMPSGSTLLDWDTKWNQTGDLTIPTDGKNCYTMTSWFSDNSGNVNASWTTYSTGGGETGGGETGGGETGGGETGGGYTEYVSAAPEQCTDVMLQAFYWDSYDLKAKYGTTQWETLSNQASEIATYFDLVWLAPSAKSSGGTGYHPSQWCNQTSYHGSRGMLEKLIKNLHAGNVKVIADIVVNHRDNRTSWCNFWSEDFGKYGQFQLTASHICKDDEVNTDSKAGSCQGSATGAYDTGEKYNAARDLDHTNTYVQNAVKAYLKWMRDEMKYDGFRFDVAKGFSPSYFGVYASDSKPYFAVGEYLDGNYDLLKAWVNGTGNKSTAFDFALKFQGLNDGLAKGDLSKLVWNNQPAGLIHSDMRRWAVTFVDNHDTFERGNGNDFTGINNKDLILQANAFILSNPGVPCVFYPHWVKYKDDIQKMIVARKSVGIHNQSAVTINESGNDKYIATIAGKNGNLILKLGAGSNAQATPAGYTKAASGTNWAMYIQVTSAVAPKLIVSPAGGTYRGGVEVTLSALNATDIYYTLDGTTPTEASTRYTSPIKIGTTNTILKVIAVGAGGTTAVQTHEYITEPRTQGITVKFRKPANWSTVYFWAWEDGGAQIFPASTGAKWPGAEIPSDGEGWYYYTFDVSIENPCFIFNDGKPSSTQQTINLCTSESACYAILGTPVAGENTATAIDCNSTAIKPVEVYTTIYPNPTKNVLYVTSDRNIDRIEIYSCMGALVATHTAGTPAQTIDVTGLQNGMYILRATLENGTTSVGKFVKQ